MKSLTYTKEIGISAQERPVPKAVTAAVLLTVAAVTVLFAREVNSLGHAGKAPTELKVSSN